MKKSEYVTKISQKLNLTKKNVAEVTDAFVEELILSLINKESVSITNLGTFNKTTSKPYSYFSPVDGKKMYTEGITRISFSMSKDLNNKVSKR
ncbi:MAG TPA: HU family DNA-binding protein [Bacilli bacterium]|nr:HU family DNA-binding protein [Bacilli bacterium]